jgi:predicted DNA-binding transcriptional regulator YafY
MAKRQIEKELEGGAGELRPMEGLQKTGYDVLVETKEALIKEIETYLLEQRRKDPLFIVTREFVAARWGISYRTASRYLTDIRGRYKPGVVRTVLDLELEEKTARVMVMKKAIKVDPDISKTELMKVVGVSLGTLNSYLESPMVTDKERALFTDRAKFWKQRREDKVKELRALLKRDRSLSRGAMSRELGVSHETLLRYLKEVEGW